MKKKEVKKVETSTERKESAKDLFDELFGEK